MSTGDAEHSGNDCGVELSETQRGETLLHKPREQKKGNQERALLCSVSWKIGSFGSRGEIRRRARSEVQRRDIQLGASKQHSQLRSSCSSDEGCRGCGRS